MIIQVKRAPSNEELMQDLAGTFSQQYTFKQFGLGKKSVIVRKSAFLGAQLTVNKNEISVHGSPPSFATGFLSSFLITELAVVILPLFALAGAYPSEFRKIEREIGLFLREKYN